MMQLPRHLSAAAAAKRGQGRSGVQANATRTKAAAAPAAAEAQQQPCETLRMHLRSLLKVESCRVLIVRKINRLGFCSSDALSEHYSAFGTVEQVLVAHSRVKSSVASVRPDQNSSRLRPSGLGFIVMSTSEEAKAILRMGQDQVVRGVAIKVQQF